jgi:hypothetical protein
MSIFYKSGYKYQLIKDYEYQLPKEFPFVAYEIETDYFYLSESGLLIVKKGYAWDGPSGPTIDTKNFMRGSLVHDALYQIIRLGYLDKNIYRILADRVLYDICRRDGMSWVRAQVVYHSVRVFGNTAAMSKDEKWYITAP